MSRAFLIFGDIEGKLDTLRVECTDVFRLKRTPLRESGVK